MTRHRVKVDIDTDTDRFAVWKDGIGWLECDPKAAFVSDVLVDLRITVMRERDHLLALDAEWTAGGLDLALIIIDARLGQP